MSMKRAHKPTRAPGRPSRGARLTAAGAAALAALLLAGCGSSGGGLIPSASAGPLQSDFEAVAQAAQTGGGECAATEAALTKTELDFSALPSSVDAGLRTRLKEGIGNLRKQALQLCAQPLANTVTTPTKTTTLPHTTTTAPAPTPTTSTTTTPTQTTTTPTSTSTTPTGSGGGTPAPGGETPSGGAGSEGANVGGVGAGGAESGK